MHTASFFILTTNFKSQSVVSYKAIRICLYSHHVYLTAAKMQREVKIICKKILNGLFYFNCF
jgi:hypothetical protein